MKNVGVDWQGQRVLHGVNLCLEPGRVTGVLGLSGSGVSFLLKTAAGLLDPTDGQVLYDGIDLRHLKEEPRRQLQTRTGFMFQEAALWANTNLEGNLMLPLQARYPDWKKSRLREHLQQTLAGFKFDEDLSLRPDRLSLGRQRFVSFLRAALPGPEALFLDEPHNRMDSPWRRAVSREVKRLRDAGAALLLGDHHAAEWCELVDHLVILGEGWIKLEGEPTEVLACNQSEVLP